MGTVDPDEERLRSFLKQTGSPEPLVMINLLRFRETAEYRADFDAEPCSGREAYERYGALVVEHLERVGGRVIWAGKVFASVIAPASEAWDEAFLVEYPSRAAFVKMITSPEYRAIVPHRSAALMDSRLMAAQPGMAFGLS